MRDGSGECLEVLRERVVRVSEARVQVAHAVVGLLLEVERVRVVHEARAYGEREPRLEVAYEAVDERGGHGHEYPVQDECQEARDVTFHYRLDNAAVQRGHVDGEERARHERARVQRQEAELLRKDAGN